MHNLWKSWRRSGLGIFQCKQLLLWVVVPICKENRGIKPMWHELETPWLYSEVRIYYARHKHLLHHELIALWCKSKLSQYITGNFRKIQPFYFTPSSMLLVCWKFLQSSNCVNCKQLSAKKTKEDQTKVQVRTFALLYKLHVPYCNVYYAIIWN